MHKAGRREVIGLDAGDANTQTALLCCDDARLVGVQLVISDAYHGLKAAVMALAVIASFDPRAIDPP